MKRIVSATLSILLVLSLSACGSGEPELSAEDIRNTAIPVAMTSLAQTQMAMPTATQPAIPPTGTLSPTPFHQYTGVDCHGYVLPHLCTGPGCWDDTNPKPML